MVIPQGDVWVGRSPGSCWFRFGFSTSRGGNTRRHVKSKHNIDCYLCAANIQSKVGFRPWKCLANHPTNWIAKEMCG